MGDAMQDILWSAACFQCRMTLQPTVDKQTCLDQDLEEIEKWHPNKPRCLPRLSQLFRPTSLPWSVRLVGKPHVTWDETSMDLQSCPTFYPATTCANHGPKKGLLVTWHHVTIFVSMVMQNARGRFQVLSVKQLSCWLLVSDGFSVRYTGTLPCALQAWRSDAVPTPCTRRFLFLTHRGREHLAAWQL